MVQEIWNDEQLVKDVKAGSAALSSRSFTRINRRSSSTTSRCSTSFAISSMAPATSMRTSAVALPDTAFGARFSRSRRTAPKPPSTRFSTTTAASWPTASASEKPTPPSPSSNTSSFATSACSCSARRSSAATGRSTDQQLPESVLRRPVSLRRASSHRPFAEPATSTASTWTR